MGQSKAASQGTEEEPLRGIREYLEEHQGDSLFEREKGKGTSWCIFLHGDGERIGQIDQNEAFEFQFRGPDGSQEKIHKVKVNFVCRESDRDEVVKQLKRDETVAKKTEGPHFLPRFRHHIKNKSLFPLMNRREVLFFTLMNGEVLRGIVQGFSKYEIYLNLKRGTPVAILRHAVVDVRDKKDRSFLKKAVEKSGEYW
jgi:sRNA-binding regulator protein Hfq